MCGLMPSCFKFTNTSVMVSQKFPLAGKKRFPSLMLSQHQWGITCNYLYFLRHGRCVCDFTHTANWCYPQHLGQNCQTHLAPMHLHCIFWDELRPQVFAKQNILNFCFFWYQNEPAKRTQKPAISTQIPANARKSGFLPQVFFANCILSEQNWCQNERTHIGVPDRFATCRHTNKVDGMAHVIDSIQWIKVFLMRPCSTFDQGVRAISATASAMNDANVELQLKE